MRVRLGVSTTNLNSDMYKINKQKQKKKETWTSNNIFNTQQPFIFMTFNKAIIIENSINMTTIQPYDREKRGVRSTTLQALNGPLSQQRITQSITYVILKACNSISIFLFFSTEISRSQISLPNYQIYQK